MAAEIIYGMTVLAIHVWVIVVLHLYIIILDSGCLKQSLFAPVNSNIMYNINVQPCIKADIS